MSGKICFTFRRCRSRCSAGEPAACFPIFKFAYPYPTASPDMTLGKRKRVTPQLRREGGQHGMAELTNKKHPHFSSVQLSPSLQSPYCMPSREHQQLREGWKKKGKEALMAKAIGRSLCPMSVFMGTLDRREWEQGLCGKGTDRKKSRKGKKRPRLV